MEAKKPAKVLKLNVRVLDNRTSTRQVACGADAVALINPALAMY